MDYENEASQAGDVDGKHFSSHHIHKHKHKYEGGDDMDKVIDIQSLGRGGGGGLGGDGGGLGLIALLALLGRRGLGGDGDNGPSAGQVAFDSTILNGINGLTASVPTTGLQTQNALLGAIGAQSLGVQQGLSNVKDSIQAIGGANLAATSNVHTSVLTTGLQTQIAIGNDGDKTRALIQSINEANLQRMLSVAENALMDERHRSRSREVEVTVSQTVNQNQAQAQAQAQQQQQGFILNHICAMLAENTQISRAAATNSNLIFGNTGASTTGAQTATPTSTNVRT